jgi:hypothetical protein
MIEKLSTPAGSDAAKASFECHARKNLFMKLCMDHAPVDIIRGKAIFKKSQ